MTDPTPSASIDPAERERMISEFEEFASSAKDTLTEVDVWIAAWTAALSSSPQGGAEPRKIEERRAYALEMVKRVSDLGLNRTDRYTAEKELNRAISWLTEAALAAHPVRESPAEPKLKGGGEDMMLSNPMFSQADRLEMASGAIKWRDEVIQNLRARLRESPAEPRWETAQQRMDERFRSAGDSPAVAAPPEPLTEQAAGTIKSFLDMDEVLAKEAGAYDALVCLVAASAPSIEQIERHTLNAGDCPPGSKVMLVSSILRLQGAPAEQPTAPEPKS